MQELEHVFCGKVAPGLKREYGKASVTFTPLAAYQLLKGIPKEISPYRYRTVINPAPYLQDSARSHPPLLKIKLRPRISIPACGG
mmetsp:Transcript_21793/g.26659  ORF Transcript_21793/g.26659 Transcript_21793/m.26659 type:complete len:85 (+) Transcript_21793:326-580(+)